MIEKSNLFRDRLRTIFWPNQVYWWGIVLVVLLLLQFLVGCNRYDVSKKSMPLLGTAEVIANSEKLLRRWAHFAKAEICNQPGFAVEAQPHYIVHFSPINHLKLSAYCYEQGGGIYAQINGAYADIIGVRPVWHRFELYVNGVRISKETFAVWEDYSELFQIDDDGNRIPIGTFSVSWLPELEIGRQEVELIITQVDGEDLTYTWSFEITR